MKKNTTALFVLILMASTTALGQTREQEKQLLNLLTHPEHAQGEMAGLVTPTSAMLQSRLTLTNWQFDNDYIGCQGWGRFMVYTNDVDSAIYTEWHEAIPEDDYIIKIMLKDLEPNTRYSYRLQYGRDQSNYRTGQICEFKTHAGADISAGTSFAVTTGMNYDKFYNHPQKRFRGVEKELGYPAAESVTKLLPDFFVGTGDNVYYDSNFMPMGQGVDPKTMRNYFHLQFGQPRMVEMFSKMSSYWEKDDHDYRYNDSDTTGERSPSHQLGIKIHKEQLPVSNPEDENAVTYGTYRVSKEAQIWILEGRDYRSPNRNADGPEKTIWGETQKNWLKNTILESDAAFRFIISPTPMIGPDDAYKSDNHVNQKGFRHERDEFFQWMKENNIPVNSLVFITGDRHWQYHSIDAEYGYNEFSTGPFVDANSRLGRNPGDPKSTDPKANLVIQPYTSNTPSGGFLYVKVEPEGNPWKKARATFEMRDENGVILYSSYIDATVSQGK